jgi:hypothetical protein
MHGAGPCAPDDLAGACGDNVPCMNRPSTSHVDRGAVLRVLLGFS